MSTFLVSFGVVAATIAAVVYVVLNGPDQPATIRRQPSRAKARRRERAVTKAQPRVPAPLAVPVLAPTPVRSAVLVPGTPGPALPESDIMRLRVLPARHTSLWGRLRSAVALMILVAILGALLALVIGAVGLGLAFLVRSATG